jgi:hypothetical protein
MIMGIIALELHESKMQEHRQDHTILNMMHITSSIIVTTFSQVQSI